MNNIAGSCLVVTIVTRLLLLSILIIIPILLSIQCPLFGSSLDRNSVSMDVGEIKNNSKPQCAHWIYKIFKDIAGTEKEIYSEEVWEQFPDKQRRESKSKLTINNGASHITYDKIKKRYNIINTPSCPFLIPVDHLTPEYDIDSNRLRGLHVSVAETTGNYRGKTFPVVDLDFTGPDKFGHKIPPVHESEFYQIHSDNTKNIIFVERISYLNNTKIHDQSEYDYADVPNNTFVFTSPTDATKDESFDQTLNQSTSTNNIPLMPNAQKNIQTSSSANTNSSTIASNTRKKSTNPSLNYQRST